MKKSVDVEELIEKKFQSNKFTIEDLMKLIEDQIDEYSSTETDYSYKFSEYPPGIQEENPEPRTYRYGQYGKRRPLAKEPGYKSRKSNQVIPDKLAD